MIFPPTTEFITEEEMDAMWITDDEWSAMFRGARVITDPDIWQPQDWTQLSLF